MRQRFNHRVPSFADRDHKHARIGVQFVKIFADAQHSALTMHVPRKCLGDRSLGQRVTKDLARSLAHMAKLRFAFVICGHGKDYKDGLSAIAVRKTKPQAVQ